MDNRERHRRQFAAAKSHQQPFDRFPLYAARNRLQTAVWLNDRLKSVAPEYPYGERLNRHQGRGIIRLMLDLKTGVVTKATIIKSTGFTILDACAVAAFQRWRWKPGKWKEIDLPITFQLGDIHAPLPRGAVPLPPARH